MRVSPALHPPERPPHSRYKPARACFAAYLTEAARANEVYITRNTYHCTYARQTQKIARKYKKTNEWKGWTRRQKNEKKERKNKKNKKKSKKRQDKEMKLKERKREKNVIQVY